MEDRRQESFNEAAKLLVLQRKGYNENLDLLAFGVMDYMMQTGTSIIDNENLYVHISFEKAEVYRFVIYIGAGQIVELNDYKARFEKQLRKNRDAGIKRLIPDLTNDLQHNTEMNRLAFGKN